MILIIDGYNLLKHLYPREKGKLSKQRDALIRQLGFYKKKKADGIKEVVIVFDGGMLGRATREIRSGIVVVFSGQKQSADDWIIEYVKRHKEKELLLITYDRALIKQCQNSHVEVLNVADFYDVVQNTMLESVGDDLTQTHDDSSVQKYETDSDNEIESEALDILMEQAPVDSYEKDDVISRDKKKKGRSQVPSKKEKKLISKLKKL